MKVIWLLVACLMLGSCAPESNSPAPEAPTQAASASEPGRELLVKDRMLLEVIVNDYVMRRRVKGELALMFPFDFDHWTNALPSSSQLIVYIYARPPVAESDSRYAVVTLLIESKFKELKLDLENGIRETILDFPEFSDVRRDVQIVLRIEQRAEPAWLQLELDRLAR